METILSILGALGGLGALYISLRKLKPELAESKATEKNSLANAVDVAAGALADALKFAQEERKEFEQRIDALEKRDRDKEARLQETEGRLREAEAKRIEREKETEAERAELQARIQSELHDAKMLRIEDAEKGQRIDKLEKMIVNQGKYIDTIKTAAQKAGIEVPLNGEVMDSVRKMQLSIEERERLKASKSQ